MAGAPVPKTRRASDSGPLRECPSRAPPSRQPRGDRSARREHRGERSVSSSGPGPNHRPSDPDTGSAIQTRPKSASPQARATVGMDRRSRHTALRPLAPRRQPEPAVAAHVDSPVRRCDRQCHCVAGGHAIRLEPGGTICMDHQGSADMSDKPLTERHAVVRRHPVTGDCTIIDWPLSDDVAGARHLQCCSDEGHWALSLTRNTTRRWTPVLPTGELGAARVTLPDKKSVPSAPVGVTLPAWTRNRCAGNDTGPGESGKSDGPQSQGCTGPERKSKMTPRA